MRPKLKISPLFIVLLLLSLIGGTFLECIIYILVVMLHEFAHYTVAAKLGYQLNTLHLMPYGAALSGDMASMSYRDEIIIALAGPIFNLLCVMLIVALWWISPTLYIYTDTVALANTTVSLLNILPIYPLDGGRILNCFLRMRTSEKKANYILKICGITISLLFSICCVLLAVKGKANFSMIFVSLFMIGSTFIKDKNTFYQKLYSMTYRFEKIKKGLAVRELLVFSDNSVASLIKMVSSEFYTRFNIVDSNLRTLRIITETQLIELAGKSEQNLTIIDLIGENDLKSF